MFRRFAILAAVAAIAATPQTRAQTRSFDLLTATIADIQDASMPARSPTSAWCSCI